MQATPAAGARWRLRGAAGVAALALLSGCASAPGADPRDPWEAYNRSMYRFNDAIDTAVLKPVATVYRDALPQQGGRGVGNSSGKRGEIVLFFPPPP